MKGDAFKRCVLFCDVFLVKDLGWRKEVHKERVLYEGPEECLEIRYSSYRTKEKRETFEEKI